MGFANGMFTGIVEEIGGALSVDRSPDGATFYISSSKAVVGLQIGDSVCVTGVCVTAIKIEKKRQQRGISLEIEPRGKILII